MDTFSHNGGCLRTRVPKSTTRHLSKSQSSVKPVGSGGHYGNISRHQQRRSQLCTRQLLPWPFGETDPGHQT